MVLAFASVDVTLACARLEKGIEQYFPPLLYSVVATFESVDGTINGDHFNKPHRAFTLVTMSDSSHFPTIWLFLNMDAEQALRYDH